MPTILQVMREEISENSDLVWLSFVWCSSYFKNYQKTENCVGGIKKCISVTFTAFWLFHCKSRFLIGLQTEVEVGLTWAMGGSWAGLCATCHLVPAVQLSALLLRWVLLGFVLSSCISSKWNKHVVFVTAVRSWVVCDLVFLSWQILCIQ